MKETKVYCAECIRRGYRPKMLAIAEDMQGSIRLWCDNCHKEIRVTITDGKIQTKYA
jgi:hypothetical protein